MTPEELEFKIKESQGVLVYFKNDFCSPCVALKPKVSDLIDANLPKMEMVIVDSFTNPSLTGQYGVFSNPTLVVFFEGREYLRKSKYISISELQVEIKRLYEKAFEG